MISHNNLNGHFYNYKYYSKKNQYVIYNTIDKQCTIFKYKNKYPIKDVSTCVDDINKIKQNK